MTLFCFVFGLLGATFPRLFCFFPGVPFYSAAELLEPVL